MSRGRQANTAYVATGEPVPGTEPQLVHPEVVLAEIIDNDGTQLTATEAIRQGQEWSGGTGHLANIWAALTRDTAKATIDGKLKERLPETEYERYLREPQRQPLQQAPQETRAQRRERQCAHRADHRRRPQRRQEHLRGLARAPVAR
jgi:hypothetical protein